MDLADTVDSDESSLSAPEVLLRSASSPSRGLFTPLSPGTNTFFGGILFFFVYFVRFFLDEKTMWTIIN
jgi:hypothetical protein